MAVNPVSANSIDLTAAYGARSQREQQAVQPPQRDVAPDNDQGDRGSNTSRPHVNTQGQTVGTLINTKA